MRNPSVSSHRVLRNLSIESDANASDLPVQKLGKKPTTAAKPQCVQPQSAAKSLHRIRCECLRFAGVEAQKKTYDSSETPVCAATNCRQISPWNQMRMPEICRRRSSKKDLRQQRNPSVCSHRVLAKSFKKETRNRSKAPVRAAMCSPVTAENFTSEVPDPGSHEAC